jgi:hypothetical protein
METGTLDATRQPPARAVAAARPVAARPAHPIRKLLRSGVGLGFLVSIGFVLWVLVGLHGWAYYATPLAVRGYAPEHRLLQPSGPAGQTFGVIGAAMMLVPFLYMIRKRLVRWRWTGSLRVWLEVHLFCGIVGPVLVTFHTSFKFNGIVSAAYWAMVTVMLSGFVGRYLYVRIPRTIRGTELSRAELDEQADALLADLAATAGAGPWAESAAALERAVVPANGKRQSIAGLLFGELGLRLRVRAFARRVRRSDLPPDRQESLVRLVTERTLLLRRVAYLQKTKVAFGLWHVFHVPLVYLLLVIVTLHVGVAIYLGYVPFRW